MASTVACQAQGRESTHWGDTVQFTAVVVIVRITYRRYGPFVKFRRGDTRKPPLACRSD
jgi:hypothetical protein